MILLLSTVVKLSFSSNMKNIEFLQDNNETERKRECACMYVNRVCVCVSSQSVNHSERPT